MSRDTAGRELVAGMTIVSFGAQVFAAHLPPYYEIRKPPALTEQERAAAERGVVISAGVTALFGAVVSWLMRETLPAVFGLVTALGFSAIYLLGIRGDQLQNTYQQPSNYRVAA